ncbi:pinopsin-like [Branchiostoma floridae]|uniref:C-type opsin n=2 Tax=Branchiostoma floridae TaxID=7739 RepID=A0A455ZAH2_BRAFL|nr:pinopsin-like [Branchiostoma floridae]DAC74044.1 TPA_exp: C-type opsin [Branchiostoma floridae]
MLGMHNVMNATDYDNNNATFAAWNFQRNGTTEEEVEFSGFDTVAVVIAAIGIAGFLSNGAVVLLFLKFRQLRTPFNMLLLNMSVADLLVSVCGNTLSFASAVRHRWLWGRPGCVWYGFANHLFGLVSLISLAVISYERYRMVVKPKGPGSSYLTYNKVGLAIIFIYLYCLLWTTLPIVGWSSYQLEGPKISCSVAWEEHSLSNTSYIVAIFIMCLLLPLLIIIYSYCRLWYKVKKGSQNLPPAIRKSSQKEQKIARMVVVMITCFLVCWLPYGAMALVVSFGGESLISPTAAVVPSLLAKSSTCYNPLVYFAMNNQFRRYFQDLLCCGRRLFDASASVNTCNTSAMPRHSPVFQKPDSDQYNGIQKSREPQMRTTGQNAPYRQWIEMQTIAVVVKADEVNNKFGEVKT